MTLRQAKELNVKDVMQILEKLKEETELGKKMLHLYY